MLLAKAEEEQAGEPGQKSIDQPKSPGAEAIEEIDKWGFVIKDVSIGNATFCDESADITKDLFVIEEDVDRGTIKQAEQKGGAEYEKGGGQ